MICDADTESLPLPPLQFVDLSNRLHYAAVQNLVNECENSYLITSDKIEAIPTYHIQHEQQFFRMVIQVLDTPKSKHT